MTIGTYGICYSIASYVNIENEKANYKNRVRSLRISTTSKWYVKPVLTGI